MDKNNAQHSLVIAFAVTVVVMLLVLGLFPTLVSFTVVAFLPHFPVSAIYTGWTSFVLLVSMVWLAIYWLREEPEEKDEDQTTHVSSSMAEQIRRAAGRRVE